MNAHENLIESVWKKELCMGCGTCTALCPNNAIRLEIDDVRGIYKPILTEENCINCGICYATCPSLDFENGVKKDYVGNFINSYIGYSTDDTIRYDSSSGGLVTQILVSALDEGIINGALVTRMNKNRPLEPEPFIARTKDEILEASRSKYCPVPANTAIREILKTENNEKYAVVGLPCHLQGIRKAEQINNKLKNKIILHIGIFCDHAPNFWGTRLFLMKLNIKEEDVLKLDYRGGGWPGNIQIITRFGEIKKPLFEYWRFVGSQFFWSRRCLLCSDGLAELGDISCGDAWLPELSNDKKGSSIVISRDKIGDDLINKIKYRKNLILNNVDISDVVKSQTGMLCHKRLNQNFFKGKIDKESIANNVMRYFMILNSNASRNFYIRKVIYKLPYKILDAYFAPFNLIFNKYKKNYKNKLK